MDLIKALPMLIATTPKSQKETDCNVEGGQKSKRVRKKDPIYLIISGESCWSMHLLMINRQAIFFLSYMKNILNHQYVTTEIDRHWGILGQLVRSGRCHLTNPWRISVSATGFKMIPIRQTIPWQKSHSWLHNLTWFSFDHIKEMRKIKFMYDLSIKY